VKPIDYSYEIVRKPEGLELVLSGLHPDKPGVKMIRILTFYAGSALIKEQVRIVNMNPEVAYDVNVRIGGQTSVRNLFRMFVPLKGVVQHETIGFPTSESDLPDDPKEFKESWVCYQDEAQDFCFGVVWSGEKLSKVRFGEQSLITPEYKLGQLKPGETACTSDLYYILERGSWQNVRRWWQSLVERKIQADVERVESKPLFNVELADTVLYDRAELKTQLRVVNYRNKEASGEVVLTPPKGWKIVPSEVKVEKVTMNNPFTVDVVLISSAQAGLGVHNGFISFQIL
jgi:hypothetical protein